MENINKDERTRVQALNTALAFSQIDGVDPKHVLHYAERFHDFLIGATGETVPTPVQTFANLFTSILDPRK